MVPTRYSIDGSLLMQEFYTRSPVASIHQTSKYFTRIWLQLRFWSRTKILSWILLHLFTNTQNRDSTEHVEYSICPTLPTVRNPSNARYTLFAGCWRCVNYSASSTFWMVHSTSDAVSVPYHWYQYTSLCLVFVLVLENKKTWAKKLGFNQP